MLTLMEQSTETCIGIEVSGEVTTEDYEKLEPVLKNAIQAHAVANLVIYLEDFEGFDDLEALRRDVQVFFDVYGDIANVAVVGTEEWQKWMTKVLDPLTLGTDERYFEPEELAEAWTWACGTARQR